MLNEQLKKKVKTVDKTPAECAEAIRRRDRDSILGR